MKPLFFLIFSVFGIVAGAQVPVYTSTVHYVQNFDSLDTLGTALTRMPAGWSFFEWGGSSVNATYRASTGSSIAGDTYSYGLSGSSERALGSLCSAGMPNVCYGLRFVNLTGSCISMVDISVKVEQWRRNGSGRTDSTLFYYSTSANARVQDTSFGHWIQVPELLVSSVTTATPAAALNGNDSSKRILFSLPLSLASGDTICFRWYDYNAAASDDGLAIDSLDMNFQLGVPPNLYRPRLVKLFPSPGAQSVPVNTIPTIEFDRGISKGSTGAVYIKDVSTQLVQSLTVGASKLKINGRIASMNFLNLQPGCNYQITFDSTTFDTAGYHCMGLYDTTAWVFSTESTTDVKTLSLWESVKIINPVVDGKLRIQYEASKVEAVRIVIADMQGRIIFERQEILSAGSRSLEYDLQAMPGVYVISMQNAGGNSRWKILVE